MADKWISMAKDGDHYKLTFDKSGTWSQKYNLVWDRLLGLNIFPAEIAGTETAYYKTKQNKYGLPLDNREDYTKSDWILWSACLTGNAADFETFMLPVWKYADETTSTRPVERLALYLRRNATRIPGPFGRRRLLYETAGKPFEIICKKGICKNTSLSFAGGLISPARD